MIILRIIHLIKRLSFLLILMTGLYATSNDISIVFVHLGDTLPPYLPCSLEQAHLFNPDATIYLIANKNAVNCSSDLDPVTVITCEELTPSKAHQQFMKVSTLDTSFRDGFWRKTTERFFYLDELIQTYNISNVFHLEYDNMIYVDLAELLPIFQLHYQGIAAIFDNDERCVPSFMYFATPHNASQLVEFMAEQTPQGVHGKFVMGFDMHSIGHYRETYTSSCIDSLPVVPAEYVQHDSFQKKTKHPDLFSNHINLFNSVFDAAALGQYLGGIDPRNGPCTPGFVNQDCIFNASKFTYLWIKDQYERKIPYLEYHGKKYRINNLHIHSKQLDTFKS